MTTIPLFALRRATLLSLALALCTPVGLHSKTKPRRAAAQPGRPALALTFANERGLVSDKAPLHPLRLDAVTLSLRTFRSAPGALPRSYLSVFEGTTATVFHLPRQGEVVIGRGREADLMIQDPKASRRHALLRCSAAGLSLEDQGSHNGTRVNGVTLSAPAALSPGDVITICEATLVLHQDAAWAPRRHLGDHRTLRQRAQRVARENNRGLPLPLVGQALRVLRIGRGKHLGGCALLNAFPQQARCGKGQHHLLARAGLMVACDLGERAAVARRSRRVRVVVRTGHRDARVCCCPRFAWPEASMRNVRPATVMPRLRLLVVLHLILLLLTVQQLILLVIMLPRV